MANYTCFHLHTDFSLIDSCTSYKAYVNKAMELGQTAIAFTEHGNLYSWVAKKLYCDEKGIKYIHGIEAYLTKGYEPKVRDNYHVILLAKNYEGVKEINRLCYNASALEHFYYTPRISFEDFLKISDNVIKVSACLASPLNAYREGKVELEDRFIDHYDYFELQPHNVPEQRDYNAFLYKLSQERDIPLIVGTDAHSLNAYKDECRLILKHAKKINYAGDDEFDLTYKSYEELINALKVQNNNIPWEVLEAAVENTNVLAASVEDFDLDKTLKYPLLHGNEDEEVLLALLRKKYKEKIKTGAIDKSRAAEYGERIKEEMTVFHKVGMSGFMLSMAELCDWCWANNIPIGYGRGSVAGSLVAYIADITDVDPLVWDTNFARFCNEDRVEVGDIDIDVSPSDRAKVYEHIIKTFGQEYTAYILSADTMVKRGTIDEIGRAFRFEWGEKPDCPYSLSKIDKVKKDFEEDPTVARNTWSKIFYYFDGLTDTVIAQSQHPAGIIISPVNLIDNYSAFFNSKGQVVLPITMEEVHEIGLVKYDILGLQNIQIIRDTYNLVDKPYQKAYKIDWNDTKVWEDMLRSSVGIFQFDSPTSTFGFNCLQKFRPKSIDDMALVAAAIRPSGESYRDRLLEHKKNANPSEEIDKMLAKTNGFLVFQEQTIQFLQKICGLTGSEADTIRRAIGRKQTEKLEAALPRILEGYCNTSSKPKEIAEGEAKAFLKIIEDSSNYQFGRNHSVAYSMIGYTCAFFRYYYPLEFLTAFFNNARTENDVANGIKLAQLKNIELTPPKFGHTSNDYTCDKQANCIYQGIGIIKNMQKIVAPILQEVERRKPDSFPEVLRLLAEIKVDGQKVNKASLAILIKIGFFDCFGGIERQTAFAYWAAKFMGKKSVKKAGLEAWLIPLIRGNCQNETEKTFSGVNSASLLEAIWGSLPEKEPKIFEMIKDQIRLLGYTNVKDTEISHNVYMVQKVHVNKYGQPWANLYHLKTNRCRDYKVDKYFYKKNKLAAEDIVKVVFGTRNKYERANTKKGYRKLNETEIYIKGYIGV